MSHWTATIRLELEIPVEAENEDDAWSVAEAEVLPQVEALTDNATGVLNGVRVYRCTVDEVEPG